LFFLDLIINGLCEILAVFLQTISCILGAFEQAQNDLAVSLPDRNEDIESTDVQNTRNWYLTPFPGTLPVRKSRCGEAKNFTLNQ